MNLTVNLNAAKKILDCIEKEAPRDKNGVLWMPYRKWSQTLYDGIAKAEAWLQSTTNAKEETHADYQSQPTDQGESAGPETRR